MRIRRLVPYFRALADESRLRLLALMSDGPVCVEDLAFALSVPQPKVSRHLAYLRKAGLVTSVRDGRRNYYKVAPGADSFTQRLLRTLQVHLAKKVDARADRKRLGRAR